MTIRGRIMLYATVWCAGCYEHLETGQHTRNDASRYARVRGWKKIGAWWFCPDCVANRSDVKAK